MLQLRLDVQTAGEGLLAEEAAARLPRGREAAGLELPVEAVGQDPRDASLEREVSGSMAALAATPQEERAETESGDGGGGHFFAVWRRSCSSFSRNRKSRLILGRRDGGRVRNSGNSSRNYIPDSP